MIYGENYETMRMRHAWRDNGHELSITYEWKKRDWHSFSVVAENKAKDIATNSVEEFITEHYWGYTRLSALQTSEYGVEHPRWQAYPVKEHHINVGFERIYGRAFEMLGNASPASVLLAEGSEILVRGGRRW